MKFIGTAILIFLLMTQTFGKWFVEISFNLNKNYIAKNLCENRYRPKMHCNGNCVLMKKIAHAEKQGEDTPSPVKTQTINIVLSSKSFFATIDSFSVIALTLYNEVVNSGKPSDRSMPVFHPPAV
jgi:hypothetical protein